MPDKVDPAPINALLEKISDLDQDKIALIARTLGQAQIFNEVVREQTSKMEVGERYQAITSGFNSIRDDSKRLENNGAIADTLKNVLEGVVRSGVLWDLLRQGYGSRPTRSGADFGSPGFPFPFPSPGGRTADSTGGDWRDPSSRGGWSPGAEPPEKGSRSDDENFSTGGSF